MPISSFRSLICGPHSCALFYANSWLDGEGTWNLPSCWVNSYAKLTKRLVQLECTHFVETIKIARCIFFKNQCKWPAFISVDLGMPSCASVSLLIYWNLQCRGESLVCYLCGTCNMLCLISLPVFLLLFVFAVHSIGITLPLWHAQPYSILLV